MFVLGDLQLGQLFRMGHWQQPQADRVQQLKNGGVRPDPQGQGQRGYSKKSGAALQQPCAMANVLPEVHVRRTLAI
jgi:hypothetical protein